MMDKRITNTLSLPGFWRGAALARTEMMRRYGSEGDDVLRYHQAIGSHESIEDALNTGKLLDDIPEFVAWQASAGKWAGRKIEAPDTLGIRMK
jgi:hypothetical protein